jgi:hypothetical protein
VDYGIDDSDPFGVGALFLAQSVAHKFTCEPEVRELLSDLLSLEIPLLPDADVVAVVEPIDAVVDRIEHDPVLVELTHALLRLGTHTPARTAVSERLFRSVLWTMLRHDRDGVTPDVLALLRASTPGARFQAPDWPRHEFFSTVVALVYLGGADARAELDELVVAARDLDYHDLAPVLEWYLDHEHIAPAR